jgi:hypothetical protein
MTTVLAFAFAELYAAARPAGPPPTITTSYFTINIPDKVHEET